MTSPLEQLLVVQQHDTRIDQLRHRHDTLPVRTELVAAHAAAAALAQRQARTEAAHHDLVRRQMAIEDEVASILDKRISVEGTLYGGSVSNPRELQALQDELASLARRASQLEDQIIELMEQVEPLDAELAQIAEQGDAGQDELIRLEAAVIQEEADIAAELVSEGELRAAAIDGIPESLVKEYDSLRGPRGGVAIARLEGSQCG
ncbi:MAG TPA: hypothetical protein VGM93_06580, partial [Acidimicrobiales bacterium]